MKALTLTQPWATLVATGAKQIETRSWRTNYRGPLAIHAAKDFPNDAQLLCFQEPFRSYLGDYIKLNETYLGEHSFPLGCIVAICELIKIVRIDPANTWLILPDEPERSFGDYSTGRYMWLLVNIVPLPEPIQAKGTQGLWEWKGEKNEIRLSNLQ